MEQSTIIAKRSTGHRILHFPLTKIVIGCILLIVVVTAGGMTATWLFGQTGLGKDPRNLLTALVTAVLSIGTYTLLFRYYEKRKITELSVSGMGRHLLQGALLGALLQSLTILLIYLNDGFFIVSVNPWSFLVPPLTMAFTSAIFEELLIRGIIFRVIEEKLGSYIALILSALIFGALHLANPNSTFAAALGLAIQAGLLLGAAYIYARNLWFPIAIHFAWNFTQSGIYGASVSGNAISRTLFTTRIEGPEWLTGGAFGPEGSVQATLFCLAAAVVLMAFSHRRGRLVMPFWKNRQA